jgi:hypothetical protein
MRRFGETYRLHIKVWSVYQARNQHETDNIIAVCLLFNPEKGGEMSHRNVGWLSTEYTALYLRTIGSIWASYKLRNLIDIYDLKLHSLLKL